MTELLKYKIQKLPPRPSCSDLCYPDYDLATSVAIGSYAVSLLGCTFTLAGAGICIAIATGCFTAAQELIDIYIIVV